MLGPGGHFKPTRQILGNGDFEQFERIEQRDGHSDPEQENEFPNRKVVLLSGFAVGLYVM